VGADAGRKLMQSAALQTRRLVRSLGTGLASFPNAAELSWHVGKVPLDYASVGGLRVRPITVTASNVSGGFESPHGEDA